MLSSKLESALNAQINAELWSAYLYLSMSLHAAHTGMPGLSHWMLVQSQEELHHARLLQRYMLSQDVPVTLRPIASVPTEWDDAPEMLRETLMHEREVTEMISDLMNMAMDERDFATMGRLRWFVDEQVEEEEQARDLLASLELVDDDSYGRYELDQQLLHRKSPSYDD